MCGRDVLLKNDYPTERTIILYQEHQIGFIMNHVLPILLGDGVHFNPGCIMIVPDQWRTYIPLHNDPPK